MPKETENLKLALYDSTADKETKIRALIDAIVGYNNSNATKIDSKTKSIDDNIGVLHDYIIGEDGNVVFYNKQEVFLAVHPVGSIFLSTSDVEPAELYGGTWEKIAEERTLMGASTAHPVNTTVEAGLPNITGSFQTRTAPVTGYTGVLVGSSGAFDKHVVRGSEEADSPIFKSASETGGAPLNNDIQYFDSSRSNPIYGASDTVQPPAYYLYIWKRIE